MTFRIINSGADTLSISIKKGTDSSWFETLETAKETARETNESIPITLGPERALITGGNWMKWRYHIKCADYDIGVSPSEKLPQIVAQINHGAIYSHSLIGSYEYLKMILEALGDYEEAKASRIDLFCDTQGYRPTLKDIDRFSTRAVLVRPVMENGKLTSLNFGKFPFYLRIYNKTAEMKKRKNDELLVVWEKSPDYRPEKEVWRIEFEIGRKIFSETGVNLVSDLFSNLRPIWLMALNWCSLKIPSKNKQKTRWLTDPVWLALEAADFRGEAEPAVRERKRKADLRRILSGAGGYLSSFASLIGETDLKETLKKIEPTLIEYYASKGESFEKRAEGKIAMLLK